MLEGVGEFKKSESVLKGEGVFIFEGLIFWRVLILRLILLPQARNSEK